MRRIKVVASVTLLVVAIIAALGTPSTAYPPFLAKAKKFGAKDCRFCHVKAEGGEPFNDRGEWLRKQKEKRGADAVDPEWLASYKKSSRKKK